MANQLKLQVVLGVLDKVTVPFKSINARAARMAGLVKKNNAHLRTLNKALKGVQKQQMAMQAKGIRVSHNLVAAENRLQAEIAATTGKINDQKKALGQLNQKARRFRALQNTAGRFSDTGGKMTRNISLPVAGGMTLAAREAILVEKSLASVAKFAPEFDGNMAKQVAFMEKVKQSTAELSMQTGKTQADIAAMYEEMGAAGVAAGKWEAYSKHFIKGAVALDMEVGELSQMALGIMASTKNKGNTAYLKALLEKANLASDMGKMRAVNVLDVANRSLGMATEAGINENAFIGLTGAALDAGARDDVTGRAWKTIVARLTSTAKLTKAQAAAWDALNIDPDKFTKAFKNDPIGKLEQLTKAVKKNADGMGELGIIIGTEFVDTVVKMGGNIDTAKKIQASLTDEQLRAKKMQAEYNRMVKTTDANLNRSVATLKYLGVTLGDQLLPRINALLDRGRPLIKATANWMKANPKLTETIIALTLALATLGPLLMLTGSAIGTLTIVSKALPLLSMLGGAFKVLLGILMANPFAIVIMGIVTAVTLLYQNWGKVVQWFNTNPFAKTLTELPLVRNAIDFVSGGIGVVVAILNGDWGIAWDNAKIMAKSAINFVLSPVRILWDWIKKIGDYVGIDFGAAFQVFLSIAEPIIATLKSAFGGLLNMIDKVISGFKSIMGMSKKDWGQLGKNAIGIGDGPSFLDFVKDSARGVVGLQPTYGGRVKSYQANANKVRKTRSVAGTIHNNNQRHLTQHVNVTQHINATSANAGHKIANAAGAAMANAAQRGGGALIGDVR
ncbi:MAG: phage tail tape measure protein [Gammaproteobacteria bacterium]|nr:MAG: phage tail tape measure protein [Gammaproteobacteria bacterium]